MCLLQCYVPPDKPPHGCGCLGAGDCATRSTLPAATRHQPRRTWLPGLVAPGPAPRPALGSVLTCECRECSEQSVRCSKTKPANTRATLLAPPQPHLGFFLHLPLHRARRHRLRLVLCRGRRRRRRRAIPAQQHLRRGRGAGEGQRVKDRHGQPHQVRGRVGQHQRADRLQDRTQGRGRK